jgi:hypothetical protein
MRFISHNILENNPIMYNYLGQAKLKSLVHIRKRQICRKMKTQSFRPNAVRLWLLDRRRMMDENLKKFISQFFLVIYFNRKEEFFYVYF